MPENDEGGRKGRCGWDATALAARRGKKRWVACNPMKREERGGISTNLSFGSFCQFPPFPKTGGTFCVFLPKTGRTLGKLLPETGGMGSAAPSLRGHSTISLRLVKFIVKKRAASPCGKPMRKVGGAPEKSFGFDTAFSKKSFGFGADFSQKSFGFDAGKRAKALNFQSFSLSAIFAAQS